MRDFRGLDVWQLAHRVTRSFPREETYGITSQRRRCSFSVAANISEGCGRSGNAEFGRFLSMVMGSASELGYFLLLAGDLKYLSAETYESVATEVGQMRRMLNRLIAKVQMARGKATKGSWWLVLGDCGGSQLEAGRIRVVLLGPGFMCL
jgi:four helix bundle protein